MVHEKINVVPIILCGGSGTRLWPLSRVGFPKQFLALSGVESLFQQSIRRANDLSSFDIALTKTLIVTNEEHRFLALDQLGEMKNILATLLLEPVARNTAPALTIAALEAIRNGNDPVLVVTSADQVIRDTSVFKDVLQKAIRLANTGDIVILGITPDQPETGYGYIQCCSEIGVFGERNVTRFVEKPDLKTAIKYLASNNYFWNGGIFVLKASIWLNALKKFRPDILRATEKAWSLNESDDKFVRPNHELFASIPAESIDYAVIDKCPGSEISIKMLPLNAGWNDLGAWNTVWSSGEADADGNVKNGDILLSEGTKNNYVHATSRLVAVVGVSNLVIIETSDALLVLDKNQSQQVKQIVKQLDEKKRNEKDLHRKVYRPWGWYDTVDEGARFKVKRIQVKPGASLSLQMHRHRAEHWIVVKGVAEVTNGDEVTRLIENQSTFIPQGKIHRLKNPGSTDLEIIEVQSGDYLDEHDIVRYEDGYGRS